MKRLMSLAVVAMAAVSCEVAPEFEAGAIATGAGVEVKQQSLEEGRRPC
jgi:hypothetical protein